MQELSAPVWHFKGYYPGLPVIRRKILRDLFPPTHISQVDASASGALFHRFFDCNIEFKARITATKAGSGGSSSKCGYRRIKYYAWGCRSNIPPFVLKKEGCRCSHTDSRDQTIHVESCDGTSTVVMIHIRK